MNDQDDITIQPDGAEEGASEEDIEAMEDRADSKVQKLKKEIEVLRKEKQEYLDGWQRAKADYVNAAKRFEEDRLASVSLGKLAALKSFLPAMDSLERAQSLGDMPDSFKGIAKQLEDAAAMHGLVKFGAVGDQFDPMQHEALGQDPAATLEEDGVITAILESGWRVNEAVVRPAKVRVASFG